MNLSATPVTDDSRRAPPRYWHTFLIALYPVASLYAANSSAVELNDLIAPSLTMLVLGAIVLAVCLKVFRTREKAFLAASWTIGFFFAYDLVFQGTNLVYQMLTGAATSVPQEISFILWNILWPTGLIYIWRSKHHFFSANRFLNAMAPILLAVTCLSAIQGAVTGDSAGLKVNLAPEIKLISLEKPEQPRNVYFLVFDRYAGLETLKDIYGFDNQPFLDELEKRGFQIAEKCHANYPRTIYSMASALNCELLPEKTRSDKYYAEMIQNHAVGRSFKSIGYDYFHFGNWYQPLRANRNADYVLPTSIFPSEFADSLYTVTPLSKVLPFKDKFSFTVNKFTEVAATAKNQNPTFVYAHFLMPHTPYVFDADRSRLSWRKTRYGNPKENYIRQLKATNTFILETVDDILKDSKTPPIIVLTADEGPYLTLEEAALDDREKMLMRSRVLGAFHFPDAADGTPVMVPNSISPVNVFRTIFARYFGADLPSLADQLFYWDKADEQGRPAESNKRFVDVTARLAE
jgi:hypothetical protein